MTTLLNELERTGGRYGLQTMCEGGGQANVTIIERLCSAVEVTQELGHPVWDADNHYYEALDAFTRHLPTGIGPRCVQWAEIEGKQYHVVGGKVSRAVANATFNPISKPGCLSEYFRGNPNNVDVARAAQGQRADPRRSTATRWPATKVLDEQGLAGCFMFPTLGMLYEELLKDDPEAVCITFRAFNRWLHEDWGFDHEGRILNAPVPRRWPTSTGRSRSSSGRSTNGARIIVMRTAAPTTAIGRRSPFDPMFDPFWARVNEAGITVVVHAGDSGLLVQRLRRTTGSRRTSGAAAAARRIKSFAIEQAVHDYLLSMTLAGPLRQVPEPAGRVGGERRRVPPRPVPQAALAGQEDARATSARTRSTSSAATCGSTRSGRTTCCTVVDQMGADRVIFGSDWPHIEALPAPARLPAGDQAAAPRGPQEGPLRQRRRARDARGPAELGPGSVAALTASSSSGPRHGT